MIRIILECVCHARLLVHVLICPNCQSCALPHDLCLSCGVVSIATSEPVSI